MAALLARALPENWRDHARCECGFTRSHFQMIFRVLVQRIKFVRNILRSTNVDPFYRIVNLPRRDFGGVALCFLES